LTFIDTRSINKNMSNSKANSSTTKRRGRPPKGGMGYTDTREALIRCGMELLTEQLFEDYFIKSKGAKHVF